MAILTFNIYVEEIWDFYMKFVDWKTTSLVKKNDKSLTINPSIELTMRSD